MKHIRTLLFASLLLLGSSAFAVSYHTVPLGHRVYTILDVAEYRGLIEKQMDVKPYSVDTVLRLFDQIEKGDISSSERSEIALYRAALIRDYGGHDVKDWKAILKEGNYQTSDEEWGSAKIGVRVDATQRFGKEVDQSDLSWDSRNGLTFYLAGNFRDIFSYDMDLGIFADKLDPDTFLFSDFTVDGEGFYMNLISGGDYQNTIPFDSDKLYTGLYLSPELDSEFFDGRLRLRFGSIKRDWGPGLNNLELSGSARSFPAFETQADLASWLHFSVLMGSLGVFDSEYVYDSESDAYREFPSEHHFADKQGYSWDNNFSAQRIEVDFGHLTFALYESVVYHRRLEFGYLNPLSVYMFEQNAMGDLDNMLAGVDWSYNWIDHAKFYGSVAMTEMNNVKHLIRWPRNIMGYQLGVEIPVPVWNFSKITFQMVYLSPFFYSHYADDNNPWSRTVNQSYVNKGFSLGYPLDPDTVELLAQFDTSFAKGWTGRATLKSQFRSAQYATNSEYGTTILTPMVYGADDEYALKSPWNFIWQNIWSLELVVTKKMEKYPVEITGGIRFELDFKRDYQVYTKTYDEENNGKVTSYTYNPGTTDTTVMGHDWESSFGVYGLIGVKIYY